MIRHPEQDAQMAVVAWLRRHHPEVLFTSPAAAGERLSIGKACRVKAMGYTAGTPDLQIYEARNGLHGLFVEMKKAQGGTVSPVQKAFIKGLLARGYHAVVCHGSQEAVDAITKYLEGK